MKTKIFTIIALMLITALASVWAISSNQQKEIITVTGKVTDKDNVPITGVTILTDINGNLKTLAITDNNGFYSIKVAKGTKLIFSALFYEQTKVTVRRAVHNIILVAEVVVDPVEDIITQEDAVASSTVAFSKVANETREVSIPYGTRIAAPALRESYCDNSAEEYSSIIENTFKSALNEPLSTFSVDVDAASYSNLRRMINQGQKPNKDAIRTEELINYFSYNYPKPSGTNPVSISTEIGACPWNMQHRLVKIGIKARELAGDNLPASNFVFLIDVSGSMYGPTRLELVKSSLKLLINNLRDKDRVAIVVYAGNAGEALPSTSGTDKQKIREALDKLTAGGSTAGGEGIQLAYKIARQNFVKGGNNRIILCTDGDFNVGVSSNEGLEKLIEQERKSGVFLSILGYGMGNYKDSKMQTLAQKGNGNHAYIDNLQEANKVLVNEFGSTLFTVAKDVKLQIEFNPARVQAYRLIGYESRLLNKEDFNNDTKDAGEMGAGHTVTAFYEVVPVGISSNIVGTVDDLKYQENPVRADRRVNNSPDLLTVKLRYKQPDGDVSKKMEVPVLDNGKNNVSEDFRFAAAVAMFGQIMTESQFKADGSFDKVILLAKSGLGDDPQGYRREFLRLVETVKNMEE